MFSYSVICFTLNSSLCTDFVKAAFQSASFVYLILINVIAFKIIKCFQSFIVLELFLHSKFMLSLLIKFIIRMSCAMFVSCTTS